MKINFKKEIKDFCSKLDGNHLYTYGFGNCYGGSPGCEIESSLNKKPILVFAGETEAEESLTQYMCYLHKFNNVSREGGYKLVRWATIVVIEDCEDYGGLFVLDVGIGQEPWDERISIRQSSDENKHLVLKTIIESRR